MSTVIWDDGVLYADTQGSVGRVSFGDGKEFPVEIVRTIKIVKKDGKLLGATGEIGGLWAFQSRKKKDGYYWGRKKFFEALILEWDGKELKRWKFYQKKILGIYISIFKKKVLDANPNQQAVMGSGTDFAIVALEAGLTPVEAIQYASDRDPWTNDEVMVLTL